ncbi:PREDICTED: F-box protein At5g25290-like [Camelina sativa]|uniref:F-box protein At5g25290-like n=1 Tax=Camelina sativa TaxID=90675 RepID=A0ABM0UR59_CAMSA|nr:PREDICTED: F-box protein At5g25290-like [Camelina sativa]
MADGRWSDLPMDILRSVLERLSFVYFNRAKMVCSHWYLCSKQTSPQKSGSPMLIMYLEDGGCGLYHPKEARVYKTKGDLPKIKFLANSGNWFLVLDSKSSLYIIDVLSQKKIHLPPLESIKGCQYKLKRVGDKTFKEVGTRGSVVILHKARNLRGLLWVDKKKEEFVVVWYFHRIKYMTEYLAFCKNAEDHYHEIPARLQDVSDMVLPCTGDSLYVLTTSNHIRKLTYKGLIKDILAPFCLPSPPTGLYDDDECRYNIAVRPSGEVLVVMSIFYGSSRPWMFLLDSFWMFLLYKKNPYRVPDNRFYNMLVKVDSLGDEALFLDLGITVPANRDLGIEPNSIYFSRTRHAGFSFQKSSCLDVCVLNIATKTLKRCFPGFLNIKLKDARWFLPS